MAVEQSDTIKTQIREFVQEVANTKGISSFTDQESLTENGVIDSLSIFRLVTFLEDKFHIRLGDEEINNDNLQSVDTIEELVLSKQTKTAR
jgi:methoxymalonate biosynthesis acyl carrier protein